MDVKPYNPQYHDPKNFREQIALLYPVHPISDREKTIVLRRSFIEVCQPSAASLDPENPGEDSARAWEIENEAIIAGAVGIFHTHPPHVLNFSQQDITAQIGLAKAHGKKWIWHGVQSCGYAEARWVCYCMVDHNVFWYDMGSAYSDLNHPIVVVPSLVNIRRGANKAYEIVIHPH